jgi:ribosomal protein S18 acetylase RimI-like enzyme
MEFRKAGIEELQPIYEMYNEVIDHQKYDRYGADWTKDVYPSLKDLEEHLKNDFFYVAVEKGRYAAAGVISLSEDPMYRKGSWSHRYPDDQVAVLHLFTVHPDFRGKGLASSFLRYLILETGRTSKVIHLDVVKENEAAFRMYEKVGFRSVGELKVYYEDTGDIVVDLMEYAYENSAS